MKEKTTILTAIKATVHKIEPQAEIVLFGSRAREEAGFDSDWDILILSEKKVDLDYKRKIRDAIFYIGLEYESTINTLILNKNDWHTKFERYPLHYEVEKDGVML